MNKNTIKKLSKEIELENYLNDISEYSTSAYNYLTSWDSNLDKDEIVMYLSSVDECIREIKNLIQELASEYEQEMGEVQ